MAVDLSKYVSGIRIESAYLPEIYLPDPFKPGPPNPLMQALKPKITVEITGGVADPVVVTPYGEPGPSMWPTIKTVGLLLVLGLIARKLLK